MSAYQQSRSTMGSRAGEKSYFDQQREALMGEIAMSFEHVLANLNKLNRSLEAINTVGNEFSSVEALWSQFEAVMAKEPEEPSKAEEKDEDASAERHVKTEEGER